MNEGKLLAGGNCRPCLRVEGELEVNRIERGLVAEKAVRQKKFRQENGVMG